MNDFILYFVKCSGVLLLFLSVYFLWLRKDTFFHGNRFFLLAGMLISLVLPFVVIVEYVEIPAVAETFNANSFVAVETGKEILKSTSIPWMTILLYAYIAGVLFFAGKFLISLASLCKLLWTSTKTKRDGQYIHVETTSSCSPFSFFKYIVYNPELYTASELEAIITHEKAHSRQLHSIDVFISKLYCVFLWFNPLAWIHQKFISQNLEFLADSAAIKQTPSKKAYQLTLLKVSATTFAPALANNFYNSLIKKRIVMLQKNQSTHLHKWKQILIIPLLIAFVMLFNTEVIAKEVTTKTPVAEELIVNDAYGDVVVTISKNTTTKELKAIQKMFKTFDLSLTYDIKKMNSNNEITAISLELKDKSGGVSSATFESDDNKPIPTIRLGRENGTLIVSSSKNSLSGNTFVYEIDEDNDNDGQKIKKKYVVRGKAINGKKGTWMEKEDVKTINIRKGDGEDIIIVNGKRVAPETIIEEEIEIKEDGKGKGQHYIFFGNSTEKEKDVEIEIIEENDSAFVYRNSGNGKPLFVIDGKIVDESKIKDISPDNIESVTVLKGESATTKYGEKAKDGAVIIKLKKN